MELSSPFVLYRLPDEESINLIIDEHPIQYTDFQQLNEKVFIIEAFSKSLASKNWAFHTDNSQIITGKTVQNLQITTPEPREYEAPVITGKDKHMQLVQTMVYQIQVGHINKGVLSRIKEINRKDESLNELFLKLCKNYPNAFVYLMRLPNNEIWCGASPEVLAQYQNDDFKTMALAGTQLLDDKKVEELVWQTKEVDEQLWVQKHLIDIFNGLDIPYSKSATYTAQAGKIAHLRNDFSCRIISQQAGQILSKLHPTPAICGTPTDKARDLILRLEKHQRKYYTGYLGLYSPKQFQLFVNLRCMMISENHYYLFVGGGITAQSQAEKEWIETENKAQTLASIITSLQN